MTKKKFVIPDWDGPNTGFQIKKTVSYIDTVACLLVFPLERGFLFRLQQTCGGHILTHEVRRRGNPNPYARAVRIHQPSANVFALLRGLDAKLCIISRVDIAVDFICRDDAQAELAKRFLTRYTLQKWHGLRRSNAHKNTHYWSPKAGDSRNIALYADRPSRTGDGSCAHLEFRFMRAKACRRAGIGELRQLVQGIDTMELLNRQARLVKIGAQSFHRKAERLAMQLKQKGRRYDDDTMDELVKKMNRPRWRVLQNALFIPNANTVNCVNAQDMKDYLPPFKRCLVPLMKWEEFTPRPHWLRW